MARLGIIIGGHALWIHGWTSQIHRKMEVAIPAGDHDEVPGRPRRGGVEYFERSEKAYREIARCSMPMNGFLLASPVCALADLIVANGKGGIWNPGIDDLDEDCLEGRGEEIRTAMMRIHGQVFEPAAEIALAMATPIAGGI